MEKLYISDKIGVFQDAMNIFEWQVIDPDMELVKYRSEATYIIESYQEYLSLPKKVRSVTQRYYLVFSDNSEFIQAMKDLNPTKPYEWSWKFDRINGVPTGYEVTSRGDRRFSPHYQEIRYKGDYISAQEFYLKCIKPLKDKTGTAHRFLDMYLELHPGLMYELAVIGMTMPFTDMFDKDGGQNRTYADLLNKFYNLK